MANPHLAALHKSVEVNIAQSKKNFKVMKDLCTELCRIRDSCRIASTVGNSVSIVGACFSILFPPVGIPLLASGVATDLSTKAVLRQQSIGWKAKLDAIMLSQKEADQAVANHFELLSETLKGTMKGTASATKDVEKIRQLKQAADLVSMMNKVCWNLALSFQHRPSVDNWAQLGPSMGALSKLSVAANVGIGISTYDMYAENTTVTDFNTQIRLWTEMVADKEKDLLYIMKAMS